MEKRTTDVDIPIRGTRPGWEYRIVDVSRLDKDVEELDRLGAEGWEAVGMVSTWGAKEWRFVHPVALLKRQLEDGGAPRA